MTKKDFRTKTQCLHFSKAIASAAGVLNKTSLEEIKHFRFFKHFFVVQPKIYKTNFHPLLVKPARNIKILICDRAQVKTLN